MYAACFVFGNVGSMLSISNAIITELHKHCNCDREIMKMVVHLDISFIDGTISYANIILFFLPPQSFTLVQFSVEKYV